MTLAYSSLPVLGYIERFVPRIPTAVLTLLAGYLVIKILQSALAVSLKTAHVNRAMLQIVQSTVNVILWLGVIALIFQSLGLNQIAIALSGSVAIIGLGIATGANKLVSDVLSGLYLAKNRDFKIGQHIKIAEVEGKVHSLDSRKVRILSADGSLFVIPNAKFDEQTWQIVAESKDDKKK